MTIAEAIRRSVALKEVVTVSASDLKKAYAEIKSAWPYLIGWNKAERDGFEGVGVIGYRPGVETSDWRIFVREQKPKSTRRRNGR
jgi:hypothetical protein